jgi:hypothetical protein
VDETDVPAEPAEPETEQPTEGEPLSEPAGPVEPDEEEDGED